jgi:hypothetical protein
MGKHRLKAAVLVHIARTPQPYIRGLATTQNAAALFQNVDKMLSMSSDEAKCPRKTNTNDADPQLRKRCIRPTKREQTSSIWYGRHPYSWIGPYASEWMKGPPCIQIIIIWGNLCVWRQLQSSLPTTYFEIAQIIFWFLVSCIICFLLKILRFCCSE